MNHSVLGALPAGHRDTLRAALAEVNAAPIDSVKAISGGASGAFPYRVEAGGRHYLVRIEGNPSPLRNPHQYVSMRLAAESGIAPRVHFIDEIARIAVTDFIAQQPLHLYPGGDTALAKALGDMLQQLQSSPAFPAFVHYPDIVARLFAHVRRTGLFADGLLDAHVERLTKLSEAYTSGQTALVASHNDPIPSNVLFDGKRLWMIDWESAYRNDPLVDVAITLDSFAFPSDAAQVLLQSWLGREPDNHFRARLEIVRALTRLYYAGVFLSASALVPRPAPDDDLSAPSVAQFGSVLADGTLRQGSLATKHVMGKMYLASFMTETAPPGFTGAV